mmetsp:Transcript_4693/g.12052  ORF Transcript_4693/g.12052 Transcript_4693/m.12052 type:complete len:220 (+) Transcript_4693:266-925(+)
MGAVLQAAAMVEPAHEVSESPRGLLELWLQVQLLAQLTIRLLCVFLSGPITLRLAPGVVSVVGGVVHVLQVRGQCRHVGEVVHVDRVPTSHAHGLVVLEVIASQGQRNHVVRQSPRELFCDVAMTPAILECRVELVLGHQLLLTSRMLIASPCAFGLLATFPKDVHTARRQGCRQLLEELQPGPVAVADKPQQQLCPPRSVVDHGSRCPWLQWRKPAQW